MATLPGELSSSEVERYSRQLLLPSFGVQSQQQLRRSRALIVGVGGLGCPAGLYLAGAGVGTLGLVDIPGELVAVSNLHRQIAHTTNGASAGRLKTESARDAIEALNPHVAIVLHDEFSPKTCAQITAQYDIVLDCTDNVRARYLVSDACAQAQVPLVSGAALGLDGQCTVLCGKEAPCYRCVFPEPPPPSCVGSCDAAGVLGPITGIVGSLMCLEALKVVAGMKGTRALEGRLLLVDGGGAEFRTVKLRPRKADCSACGCDISLDIATFDYDAFVNGIGGLPKKVLIDEEYRISVGELERMRKEEAGTFLLLDVRPENQFLMCSLDTSKNEPIDKMDAEKTEKLASMKEKIVVLCRRGNKSQNVTQKLLDAGKKNVVDVRGGLQAWHHKIDPEFPLY